MIRNYLKIGLRNLSKHLTISLINLTGLTLGMTSVIIIYLFVQDEVSYDKFHKESENIYRIAWFDENPQTRTPHPMAEAMVKDFPEVEDAVSLSPIFGSGTSRLTVWIKNPNNNLRFDESGILAVDSTFFKVFSFPLVKGNVNKVLRQPGKLLISESMALKYFGDGEAVGQLLEINEEGSFMEVEGVFKDIPDNSHFHFDFLLGYVTMKGIMGPESQFFTWADFGHFNYIRLRPDANPKTIEAGLLEWSSTYLNWDAETITNMARANTQFKLQPITDIHLQSNIHWELESNGNLSYVYIMSAAGLIILIIACFNFINLTTAKSSDRANEVGIRKTLGARKMQLILQFLSETMIMALIAGMFAAVLSEQLLPAFNVLTGKNLQIDLLGMNPIVIGIVGLSITIGLMAGIFPAFYLSQITPIEIIGGKFYKTAKGKFFWKLLVGLQFTLTIFLLSGSFVIYKQLNFLQSKALGFNQEEVVLIPVKNSQTPTRLESLRTELMRIPGVVSVAGASNTPGEQFNRNPMFLKENNQNTISISEMRVDYDIFKTLNLQLVEGRAFSKEFGTDSATTFILNQTAAQQLSPNEPIIGKLVILDADGTMMEGTVIGVVKDFNYMSLHKAIDPLAMQILPWYNTIIVRISTTEFATTIDEIHTIWKKFEPNHAFDFTFLNDKIEAQYGNEQKMGRVFSIFSTIAIMLSCLGIFGLATLSFSQRTKEVGIRKILGASIIRIMWLLINDFSWIILLAIGLAIPASIYVMSDWLTNFTYRIQIGLWPLLTSAGLTVLVAWVTIGYLTWSVASENPVVSLRDE